MYDSQENVQALRNIWRPWSLRTPFEAHTALACGDTPAFCVLSL